MDNRKKILSLLLGASVFAMVGVTAVQSQMIVGTQDFSITVEEGNVPDAFTFAAMNVYGGESAVSDPVLLTGFTGPLPITVSGTGSPEYSLDGGLTFTSAEGVVNEGDSLILRVAASVTAGQTRTGTVTTGGQSTTLSVTASAAPSTGILLLAAETNRTDVPVSTWFESRFVDRNLTVPLDGTPFSVTSGMEYKLRLVGSGDPLSTELNNYVAALPWSTGSQTLAAGTYELLVRVRSSDQYETNTTDTLAIGPVSRVVSLTTAYNPADYTLGPFLLAGVTADSESVVTSDPVTVSGLGLDKAALLSVSSAPAGRNPSYSINDGGFSAGAREIRNGDVLRFRLTAPFFDGASAILTAQASTPSGSPTASSPWTVTAQAPAAAAVDQYAFNWQYFPQGYFGSFPGDIYESEVITLAGGTGTRALQLLSSSGNYNSGSLNRWPALYGTRIYYLSTNTTITTSLTNDSNRVAWSTLSSNHPNIVTDMGRQIRLKYTPANGSNETYTVLCVAYTCAEHIWTNSSTRGDPRAASPFSIADVTGVAQNTMIASDPVQVSWPARTAGVQPPNIPIAISGAGTPEYRVNGGAWRSTSAWIASGSTVEVRLTSAPTVGTDRAATLSVGTTTSQFVVRTEDVTIPDAFTLSALTGVTPDTPTTSAPVTITGISTSIPVSVSGEGAPQLSTDGGLNWGSTGTVAPNGSILVRLTSTPAYETTRTATLDVNGVTGPFGVTTGAFSFTLAAKTDASLNGLIVSDPLTVSPYLTASAISVSGGGSPAYSLDGGAFTSSAGSITGGQVLRVRLTASSVKNDQRVANVTIGSATAEFGVTTVLPEACEFGSVGSVCSDGAVYAGIANGHKIFAAPSSVTGITLKTTATVTMGSVSNDGLVNMQATERAGLGVHPAANACAARGPGWVVPSSVELQAMYTNRASAPSGTYVLSGTTASRYWSSTELSTDPRRGTYRIFSNGTAGDASKNLSYNVHCIRYSLEDTRTYEDPCASGTPAIGTMCGDGAVYAGVVGGRNVFFESTASASAAAYKTAATLTTGTHTTTDAVQARLAMGIAGLASFPGQSVCAAKGESVSGSAWYLPTRGDLQLLITNRSQGVLRQMTSSNASGTSEVPRYIMSATQQSDVRYADFLDKGTSSVPAFGTSTTYLGKASANKAVLCMRFDEPKTYVDPCAGTPSTGQFCADGSVFAGSGMYVANSGTHTARVTLRTSTAALAGTTSATDGAANTNAMITAGNHPAAQVCRNLGAEWYLPAINQLTSLSSVRNTGELVGMYGTSTSSTALGARYWSSTQATTTSRNRTRILASTTLADRTKTETNSVICVRN